MMVKLCTRCTEEKDISLFYRKSQNRPGYLSWCKKCKNKDDIANTKKYNATSHGTAKRLLDLARRRAIEKELLFDLDREWIKNKIDLGFCEASGIPFNLSIRRGPFTPSLDKINPKGNYTKDNVQVVVCIYNFAKSNYTHEDVVTLAKALLQESK